VGGVQALAAQQRALIAWLGQPVVLGQDRQLVLRAEPTPPRRGGRVISHDAIMRRHKGGGHAHDQQLLSRPERDQGLLQVSHVSLTDRDRSWGLSDGNRPSDQYVRRSTAFRWRV